MVSLTLRATVGSSSRNRSVVALRDNEEADAAVDEVADWFRRGALLSCVLGLGVGGVTARALCAAISASKRSLWKVSSLCGEGGVCMVSIGLVDRMDVCV